MGNSSLSLEMEAMAMSKGMMKMVQKPFLFSGLLSTNKSVFFHGCASPLVALKSRHPNSGILSSPSKSCSTVCKISRKSFIVRASSSSPSTGFFSHSILKSRISSYRVILLLNGTFRLELVPYVFLLVVLRYTINNFFPLVMEGVACKTANSLTKLMLSKRINVMTMS